MSRIGPIERFPRPRSLANYFGLTPGCQDSGNIQDRLGSITKQGSKTARFILGQLVLHVLKSDPKMRNWYRAIKLRRGSKIARVAVMRRLMTILWHTFTHKERYTIGGPPPRLRKKANLSLACPQPITMSLALARRILTAQKERRTPSWMPVLTLRKRSS
ncbi:MAG: transposase [Rubinisphaera brasiliensis]|uniref:transposase n=1 Tax=Rubinisphaera brasiliensis TaxID=119 RepID=UPI00391A8224